MGNFSPKTEWPKTKAARVLIVYMLVSAQILNLNFLGSLHNIAEIVQIQTLQNEKLLL